MEDKIAKNEMDVREIEKEIIGCILNNPSLFPDALQLIQFEDFITIEYRIVFDVCSRIDKNKGIINIDTIRSFIKSHEELLNCFYDLDRTLDEAWYSYSTSADLDFLCNQAKTFSINRQIKNYFQNQIVNVELDINNFDEYTFKWTNDLSNIIHKKKNDKIFQLSDIIAQYQEKMSKYDQLDHKELRGTPTGFKNIDRYTDGFQRGDLIILAARPGTGKTALALNFALNSAQLLMDEYNRKQHEENSSNNEKEKFKPIIVIFSMEMGKDQLIERMAASCSSISISQIRKRNLNPVEKDRLNNSLEKIQTLPIYINDSSDLSIMDIQADLHRLRLEYDIRLVIVDYLQLLKGQPKDVGVNRQQEVSNISRLLKLTARENNTPILALAQLSREIEKRPKTPDGENPRPLLSDLRESGAIEQDADLVTFLYIKYNFNVDYKNEDEQNKTTKFNFANNFVSNIEFIIAKHRNGPTADAQLTFIKDWGKFNDYENE